MRLYLVFGVEDDGDDVYKCLYGCFSSEEKAEEIRKNLRENQTESSNEVYEIEEHILDEPTELYDFMMEP